MSRSYRRTPIFGNTLCSSEKKDKQLANRSFRRTSKMRSYHNKEMPLLKELSDVWSMGKDGKHYWNDHTPEAMRK